MAYKIQPLVESNYDFASVFAEKQRLVREATGLDFDLASIVTYLQKTTNNFTIDNQVAHDLDNAIYDRVQDYKASIGDTEEPLPEPLPVPLPEPLPVPLPEPLPVPVPEKTEEEKMAEIKEAIELLELLGDDADDEAKEALEILKMLI